MASQLAASDDADAALRNKAVTEFKKAEQEVLAGENEIGIWENE